MIYYKKAQKKHATLDSQLVFDECFNKQIAFLKNALATFCRSDEFKSFHTFVQPSELIRSATCRQNYFQIRDLLHIEFGRIRTFEKNIVKQYMVDAGEITLYFGPMVWGHTFQPNSFS